MTDRVLTASFAPLWVTGNNAATKGWDFVYPSEYRALANSAARTFVAETTIDLSGYAKDDLTVYFRNSFEQVAGAYSGTWEVPNPAVSVMDTGKTLILESVILSTVPIDDRTLLTLGLGTPGFTPINTGSPAFNPGTFDRTHIIHGHNKVHSIDTTFASTSFDDDGSGYYAVVNYNDFSSLEPTAADRIYCYRVFALPQSQRDTTSIANMDDLILPANRVILNCMIDKEPDLDYMMRLKRSYELANQV